MISFCTSHTDEDVHAVHPPESCQEYQTILLCARHVLSQGLFFLGQKFAFAFKKVSLVDLELGHSFIHFFFLSFFLSFSFLFLFLLIVNLSHFSPNHPGDEPLWISITPFPSVPTTATLCSWSDYDTLRPVPASVIANQAYHAMSLHSLSPVLTLWHTMMQTGVTHDRKDLSSVKELVVHVVGASDYETSGLETFKELLFLCPWLEKVEIVLVGPEVRVCCLRTALLFALLLLLLLVVCCYCCFGGEGFFFAHLCVCVCVLCVFFVLLVLLIFISVSLILHSVQTGWTH